MSQAKTYQAGALRRRSGRSDLAEQYGGQGLPGRYQTLFNNKAAQYDLPIGPFGIGFGMCMPTMLDARHRGPEGAIRPPSLEGRGDLVPAVLRALVGLGPRQPALFRGQGRRRVGAQRPEGLDVRGPLLAVRHPGGPQRPGPAEASRPVDVHPGHELARGHRSALAPDDRRGQLQRGLLRRRPHSGGPDPGRTGRRLAVCHHRVDERAGVGVGPEQRREDVPAGSHLDPPEDGPARGVLPRPDWCART